MKETDIIERSFLQQLRKAAQAMANSNLNPLWERAYLDLATAADRLDAMNARIEIPSYMQGKPLEIGKEVGVVDECIAPECECDNSSGCGCNH